MSRVLAAAAAIVLALVLAVLVVWMVAVAGLPLCSDASGGVDCIEGSSLERSLGLLLGFAATLAAAVATAFAIGHVARGTGGRRAALAAAATPVLALGALLLLPLSF